MRKILLLLVVSMFILISCEQEKPKPVCQFAKIGCNMLGDFIAVKWGCSSEKVSDFVYKPIADKYCGQKAIPLAPELCKFAVGFLVELGEDKVVSKFDCDKDKVDFSSVEKLCNLINK